MQTTALPMIVALACAACLGGREAAGETPAARAKVPILLDCDIGTDIDDTFALALAVLSPELDLRGVTTVSGDTQTRARMVCRLLTAAGHRDIPVAAGRPNKPPQPLRGFQVQYARHPAVIFDRTSKPLKQEATEFLYERLKAEPGKITLVSVGPLSNIAHLLTAHPDCKPWIKRLVLMGGSVHVGYNNQAPPQAEFNIRADPAAAQVVFTSGVPLTVAPLDATTMLKLNDAMLARIFGAGTQLNYQVQALYQLWDQQPKPPTMYDPVAVTLAFEDRPPAGGYRFCKMEDLRLVVDDKGFTRIAEGKPNARVATSIRKDDYLKWFVDRFASVTREVPEGPPRNVSQPVSRGGLPHRVHVFEDYETDIEKRWWMSGKGETQNVPPGSRRVARAVLTQDFDAKMGNLETMYAAVIFNPVPGPPMGKHPRVSFRYHLKGTDTIRVQIYSLTNGYHRYLRLTGLPQGRWESATVDMTQVRRPDGSGGPLSEDERIDDIQFYVDPRAELLIDDVVLYDAAPEGETRPFPKRFLFTGWFDTGKQDREWPGDFEIVEHGPPVTWKAARSVAQPKTGRPWIRLDLRGPRKLDELVRLRFLYRLARAEGGSPSANGDRLRITLVDSKTGKTWPVKTEKLATGKWAEATVDFRIPTEHAAQASADELHLVAEKGAELLIDDLLLYVPGKTP